MKNPIILMEEIEVRFMPDKIPFELNDYPYVDIEQLYISLDPQVRIRKRGNEYYMTIKGTGEISREQIELEITGEQYYDFRPRNKARIITKRRYFYPIQESLTAEIDVFSGFLSGLTIIEVEFPTIEAAQSFVPPEWFGKSVTLDERYKNSQLALHGMPTEK